MGYLDGLGRTNDSIESNIGPEMILFFCFQQQRGLIDIRASKLKKGMMYVLCYIY